MAVFSSLLLDSSPPPPRLMIETFLAWYSSALDDSMVLTIVGTIVAIALLVALARAFLKVAIVLLIIIGLAILGMYLVSGEAATEEMLNNSADKVREHMEPLK